MNTSNICFESARSILIVDDDEVGANARAAFLSYLGFFVATAYSPKEGLTKAQEGSYDVLIVDFDMPEMNGLEMIDCLKNQGYRGTIVMLSGRITEPEHRNGYSYDQFFSKGESLEPLVDYLRSNACARADFDEMRKNEMAARQNEYAAKE